MISAKDMLRAEIERMIDTETRAWDEQDPELLVSIFHADMVWPWPPDNTAHDPMAWVFVQGRFNRDRWRDRWRELFENYILVHNHRETLRIEVSAEGDGAFAVVDVDTLWRHRETGDALHWKGRAGKGYTLTEDGWKLIFHTGLLIYPDEIVA
ncbi:MAG: nuclear transport factor 2 family protein [Deltaproteobacteria bacterium]|nr:nuclear transport factor 2 family protein [Candidatus Zymogenaceae bacterium]